MPKSVQRWFFNWSYSRKEPSSTNNSMRSRAVNLPRLCCTGSESSACSCDVCITLFNSQSAVWEVPFTNSHSPNNGKNLVMINRLKIVHLIKRTRIHERISAYRGKMCLGALHIPVLPGAVVLHLPELFAAFARVSCETLFWRQWDQSRSRNKLAGA